MFQKSLLGMGFAHASKLKQVSSHDTAQSTVQQWWRNTPFTQPEIPEEPEEPTPAVCYPGHDKGFDSFDEAVSAAQSSMIDGHYVDTTFEGWTAFGSPEYQGTTEFMSITDIEGYDGWYFWGPEGIRPEGVAQGGLCDCWLLASMAALAEHGSRIEALFSGQGKQENGLYVINFYVLGEPMYLTVDDRIPVWTNYYGEWNGNRFAQRSDAGAWWLPILEKAYVKLTRSYSAMSGGWGTEAFRALTGMPVKHYIIRQEFPEPMDVWQLIKKYSDKKFAMTSSSDSYEDGLIGYHAYTLLGVNDERGEEDPYVIVRNPWSREEYTGPGSDQTDDGIFEMPLQNFYDSFSVIEVAFIDNWIASSLGKQAFGANDETVRHFVINNPEQQEFVVTLDINPGRALDDEVCPGQPDIELSVILMEGENKVYRTDPELAKSRAPSHLFPTTAIYLDQELPAGFYTIAIDTKPWNVPDPDPTAEFTLMVYSKASNVEFITITIDIDGSDVSDTVNFVEASDTPITDGDASWAGGIPPELPYECNNEQFYDSWGDKCTWYDANLYACEQYPKPNGDSAADCCDMCKQHLNLQPEEETDSNDSTVVDEVVDETASTDTVVTDDVVEETEVVDEVVEDTTSEVEEVEEAEDCVCDICGDYLMTNAYGTTAWHDPNDWHSVTISQNDDCGLVWFNAAGASWGIDYDAEARVVTTHDNCPWGVFEMTVDENGVIMNTSGEGALQEPYTPADQVVYDEEACVICGDYLMTNAYGVDAWHDPNDWHSVTISQNDDGGLLWSNAAGASWGIDYDAERDVVTTHADCPWGVFEMTVDENGVIKNTSGEGALQEPYTPADEVVY